MACAEGPAAARLRLIVTRPRAQGLHWVQALCAQGVEAVALPLIDIAPVADASPLRAAWASLGTRSLVMFVSANAVQAFFEAGREQTGSMPPWPGGVLAGCTGAGTRAALHGAGVPDSLIVEPPAGASTDSEGLWQALQARDWTGARVLVVRGEQGRDWLAERLGSAGADVQFLCAYQRLPPALDEAGHELLQCALREPQAHLWLFSSAEAVENLGQLAGAPGGPSAGPAGAPAGAPTVGPDWSRSQALATHPRIAQAARALGWAEVSVVPGPLQAVVEAVRLRAARLQSASP